MAARKFHHIYQELEQRINTGVYQDTLPTESVLTQEFQTSRNTIRRAIALLSDRGYVYSVKGSGVVILESFNGPRWSFGARGFNGLRAIKESNHLMATTEIANFKKIIVTAENAPELPFEIDEVLYLVDRIRVFDGHPMIWDHSFFRADQVPALSKQIVAGSIYDYFRKEKFKIIAAKRSFTVMPATPDDYAYLELGSYNCVGVMEDLVFSENGLMFEYTQSRFIPDRFSLSYFDQDNGQPD
ncbi:GntR family transcriptional regulator [Lapidilactobacillus achengensis]|uniref:GntR family transcriptional regulator n=1 Tax=Lapidilactobacillus achengensis TaxID=2486000 RepID=A0ABW1UR37_9LACO|nr:GntR family transcriptional regulator [Lapidilactobacillus achengensis]